MSDSDIDRDLESLLSLQRYYGAVANYIVAPVSRPDDFLHAARAMTEAQNRLSQSLNNRKERGHEPR